MPADDEENPPSSSPAAQENDDKKENENSETNTANSPTNNAATATERRPRTDYPPATPLTSNVWNKKEEEETSVAARASLNLVSVVGDARRLRGYDRSFDDIELGSLQTSSDCMAKLTCPVRPPAAATTGTAAASLVSEDDADDAELTPRTRRRLFKSTAV